MNTPRNFALQLGALITLYASIASFTTLLFGVITTLYPDAADGYYVAENAVQAIRFSIATLIVVFPSYLWLTRTVNQIRREADGKYLTLTKWLIYLSLLVGGGILAGDLIALINGYLNGDLTIRFALKALVLAAVIFAAFYYYLRDAQGHWQDNEKTSKLFALGAVVFVVGALLLGFMHSDTPQTVREAKIDDNQITDLQEMQNMIMQYYALNYALPETLTDAYGTLPVPEAPDDRPSYGYSVTATTTYQLCATFAQDSAASTYRDVVPAGVDKNYTWTHGEGEWCFDRVVGSKGTENID